MKKLIILSLLLTFSLFSVAQFDLELNTIPIPVPPGMLLNTQTSLNYSFRAPIRTGLIYENYFDYNSLSLRFESLIRRKNGYNDDSFTFATGCTAGYNFQNLTASLYIKQDMKLPKWERMSIFLMERVSYNNISPSRFDLRVGIMWRLVKPE